MTFNSKVTFHPPKRFFVSAVMCVLLVTTMGIVSASGADKFGDVYAIKAGHIITVSGTPIENGTILIRNGLIEAVGTQVTIPPDAEIVEADTMYVYPGLIDAHTSLALAKPKKEGEGGQGQRQRSQTRPSSVAKPKADLIKSHMQVVDMLNPKDSKIGKFRELGITTALSVPDKGIFIGQSSLINLQGEVAEAMVLKSPVAQHLGYQTQSGSYPSTLFGVVAYQRQTLLDARHHKALWKQYKAYKQGIRRPLPNKSLDALIPVIDGKMPVIVHVNKVNEMKRALRLADEFGLNVILSGVTEGWKVADLLKARGKPVLVSLNYPKAKDVTDYVFKLKVEGPSKDKKAQKKAPAEDKEKGGDKNSAPDKKKTSDTKNQSDKKKEKKVDPELAEIYANAGALYKAGVKFALTSRGLTKESDIPKNVALAIKHGLPAEEALKAMTLYPAQILGVSEQLGSIEAGKIANLVVTSGPIFEEKTKIRYVFVDGQKTEIKAKKAAKKATVDVTGTWEMVVSTQMGEMTSTLTLKQEGEDVTGSFKSDMGEGEIKDGTISGNSISFTVTLSIMGQDRDLTYSGTVEGDSMEGTLDLGQMGSADWKATRPGV